MSVCAVLGGMRSFVAIAQWARDSVESCPQLREQLGVLTVAPAEPTFRRTLQRLDAAHLDRLLGARAAARTAAANAAGDRTGRGRSRRTERRYAARAAPQPRATLPRSGTC